MLNEAEPPFSRCLRTATCDGFPCLVHAKSDAEVLGVRPALEHPNVTLVTNARAVKLVSNDAGTVVTGVEVDHADLGSVGPGSADVVFVGSDLADSVGGLDDVVVLDSIIDMGELRTKVRETAVRKGLTVPDGDAS